MVSLYLEAEDMWGACFTVLGTLLTLTGLGAYSPTGDFWQKLAGISAIAGGSQFLYATIAEFWFRNTGFEKYMPHNLLYRGLKKII